MEVRKSIAIRIEKGLPESSSRQPPYSMRVRITEEAPNIVEVDIKKRPISQLVSSHMIIKNITFPKKVNISLYYYFFYFATLSTDINTFIRRCSFDFAAVEREILNIAN